MMAMGRITSHDVSENTRHRQCGDRGGQNGNDLHSGHSSSLLRIHLAIICRANDPKKQLTDTISEARPTCAAGSVTFTACVRPPTAKTATARPLTKVAVSFVRSLRVSLDMVAALIGQGQDMRQGSTEGKPDNVVRLAGVR